MGLTLNSTLDRLSVVFAYSFSTLDSVVTGKSRKIAKKVDYHGKFLGHFAEKRPQPEVGRWRGQKIDHQEPKTQTRSPGKFPSQVCLMFKSEKVLKGVIWESTKPKNRLQVDSKSRLTQTQCENSKNLSHSDFT